MTNFRVDTDPVCLDDVVEEVAKEIYRNLPWRAKLRYWWATVCLAATLLWRGRA